MEIDYDNIKLQNKLGSGKFGRVFEGNVKDQEVVYKILKYSIHSDIFENEINIMKHLAHPNIPKLVGYCQKNSFYCIIIERCQGIDLLNYIEFYDISQSKKKYISTQLLDIVEYLHSVFILHQDIKPENIIIDMNTTNIKLIDFGISTFLVPQNKIKGIAGSMGYMAPEIIKNEFYSYPSDIYSYGMTLFVLWSESTPKKHSYILSYLGNTCYKQIIYEYLDSNPIKRPSIKKIRSSMVESNIEKKSIFDYLFFCC